MKTKSVPSKQTEKGEPFVSIRKDVARAFRANEVVVLLAINGHAWGDKTTASPAVKTLKKITKLSLPTVERAIRKLCTDLWYFCPVCGDAYLMTQKAEEEKDGGGKKTSHVEPDKPEPPDRRTEYERVIQLKKSLSLKGGVFCMTDKHAETERPLMQLRGPAMKRTARTGTSNLYTIFRDE